jgi:hypothetical protein
MAVGLRSCEVDFWVWPDRSGSTNGKAVHALPGWSGAARISSNRSLHPGECSPYLLRLKRPFFKISFWYLALIVALSPLPLAAATEAFEIGPDNLASLI